MGRADGQPTRAPKNQGEALAAANPQPLSTVELTFAFNVGSKVKLVDVGAHRSL